MAKVIPPTANGHTVRPRKASSLDGTGRHALDHPKARVSIVIPAVLDQNIEFYAVDKRIPKNAVVAQALQEFLSKHKPPRPSW